MPWEGMGITFGYQDASGFYKGSVRGDLEYLWDIGFRRIRMVGNVNDATMAYHRTNAPVAKALGYYVIFGCSVTTTITSANWPTYVNQVLAEAQVAATNNIDEFVIGNEEELRNDGTTVTDEGLITLLKNLATSVRETGYTGTISYQVSNGAETQWFGVARGNIDKLGFNTYGDQVNNICTRSSFQSRMAALKADSVWGSHCYISEFNTHYDGTDWTAESLKPEVMTAEVANRLDIIKKLGFPSAYFFCWGNTQSDQFAANRGNGTIGPWFQPIATNNKRRLAI